MEQIVVTKVSGGTLTLLSKARPSTITRATQSVELNGVEVVDITVESGQILEFSIGDKVTIVDRDYTLNSPPREQKSSAGSFVYELRFEGPQYDLIRAAFSVNVSTTGGQLQDIDGDSLTGDLKMFLDVVLANANRVFPAKWTLGSYPNGTAIKTVTFSETDNCLSVLQRLCSKDLFDTDFQITVGQTGNRVLYIGASGATHTHKYEYGKGKGIYELSRSKSTSANIITRLYAYGATKNIATRKYRASRLCLPDKTKSESYVQDDPSVLAVGVWEGVKIFDDIYPRRTGVISALGDSAVKFIDSSMDFDLNEKDLDGETTKYLVPGGHAKVHFNTGKLAGYEFQVSSYDHATKQFILLPQTDENKFEFPSMDSEAFQLAVGDQYVLLDIYMPDSYITSAEADLLTKAQDYLAQNCQAQVQYSLKLDRMFLSDLVGASVYTNVFWVGDHVPIKDNDLGIDKTIRVRGFTRDLMDPYTYDLTISDFAAQVTTVTRIIGDLMELDNIVRINDLANPAKARKNWLNAQELLSMIFDVEGNFYTEKIKPLSIDTTMLSVGAKSMQFGVVGAIFQVNYLGAKNRIAYSSGVLTHYAVLTDVGQPMSWNFTGGDVTLTHDGAFYIYAVCNRANSSAQIVFSDAKALVESSGTTYHFLIGVVNSPGDYGERSISLMYGFTTINGRFIKTGRIQSADGETYFDLDASEFQGDFKFKSGQSVELAISALANFIDNVLPGDLAYLQNQIDGVVDNWFYPWTPSLINYPANQWNTALLKAQHIGDTFTNTEEFVDEDTTPDAGKSWRWIEAAGVYSWTPIADSDAVKALLAAARAQDTADGKRRVFVNTPYPPYEVGDLWVQGPTGDIYKCNVARLTGSFVSSDWEKASKYTDDTTAAAALTAANAAQITANQASQAAVNAAADAAAALDHIDDIVSDSILSAAEKPSQRLAWDTISGEKSGIDAQADLFVVSRVAYDNNFQLLANYLNGGATYSSGVPLWIANASLNTDTEIDGTIYRAKWKAYYDARTALLNVVAAKAKEIADAAQADVWLLRVRVAQTVMWESFNETQAQFEIRWTNHSGSGNRTLQTASDGMGGLVLRVGDNSGNDQAWMTENNSLPYDPSRLYVVRCRIRRLAGSGTCYIGIAGRNQTDSAFVNIYGADMVTSQHYIAAAAYAPSSSWVEYEGFFQGHATTGEGLSHDPKSPSKLHNSTRFIRALLAVNYNGTPGIFEVDYISVGFADVDTKASHYYDQPVPPYRKGDLWTDGNVLLRCVVTRLTGSFVPTDWQDAVAYDNTSTTISGGLITTGTIQVVHGGDSTAGMTGATSGDSAVRFWAGGTYANRASAPFRVTQGGKLYALDAIISGSVTAGQGNISGFALEANRMIASLDDDVMILSAGQIKFENSNLASYVKIGSNTLPIGKWGINIAPIGVSLSRVPNPNTGAQGNWGVYLSVTGALQSNNVVDSGNMALYIEYGGIAGFRPRTRVLTANAIITPMDTVVLAENYPNSISLTLPAYPEPGQMYVIRSCTSSGLTLLSGTGRYMTLTDLVNKVSSLPIPAFKSVTLHWDPSVNTWWASVSA